MGEFDSPQSGSGAGLVDSGVPGGGWHLARSRILIVDDEPSNVRLLERILASAGARQVRSTTDPRSVLELFAEFAPDVVLLDIRMPHLDGFAVMQQLNAVVATDDFVPMVVLTADASSQTKERALRGGATDYLTKPFDRSEVLLRVQNLLQRRFLHTELRQRNRLMAQTLRAQAEEAQRLQKDIEARRDRARAVLDIGGPRMVFQAIFDLRSGALIGVEALARFDTDTGWGPDRWFAEAAELGLGLEFELAAITAALVELDSIPAKTYLAVNVSAATLLPGELTAILADVADRVVIELTEHARVNDYDALAGPLAGLRSTGVRFAVDDAGSGYASLQHILRLGPDIIKLDLELTRSIDTDPARRALAAALVSFAQESGAVIVAEGIETAEALRVLQHLGIGCGQGYHLARPVPPVEVARFAAGTPVVGAGE
jgi:EAL domain-containing protein (putative c-di-GMP-specific phosphodiesterase class I)/CheY-like chemotaxis protein